MINIVFKDIKQSLFKAITGKGSSVFPSIQWNMAVNQRFKEQS